VEARTAYRTVSASTALGVALMEEAGGRLTEVAETSTSTRASMLGWRGGDVRSLDVRRARSRGTRAWLPGPGAGQGASLS
jgi:hypothetical protein